MTPDRIPVLCKAARHAAPVFAAEGWVLAGADNNPPDEIDLLRHLARMAESMGPGTAEISSGRFSIREDGFGGTKVTLDVGYLEEPGESLTERQADEGFCCREECCGPGSWCCSHANDSHRCAGDDELPGMWSHADFTGGQEEVRPSLRFQSKPSLVEAILWTGANARALDVFAPGKTGGSPDDGGMQLLAGVDGAQGWVDVPVGHWLVRQPGDPSDVWPVDPDRFADKYEAVTR